jgi:broad specificity phosphatase PhoE
MDDQKQIYSSPLNRAKQTAGYISKIIMETGK